MSDGRPSYILLKLLIVSHAHWLSCLTFITDEPKSRPVESDDDALERELNEELGSFEVVGGNPVSTIDEKEIDALLDLK